MGPAGRMDGTRLLAGGRRLDEWHAAPTQTAELCKKTVFQYLYFVNRKFNRHETYLKCCTRFPAAVMGSPKNVPAPL